MGIRRPLLSNGDTHGITFIVADIKSYRGTVHTPFRGAITFWASNTFWESIYSPKL
jgi:hypothetical protein